MTEKKSHDYKKYKVIKTIPDDIKKEMRRKIIAACKNDKSHTEKLTLNSENEKL